MPERLLIIEDEETLCDSLKRVLTREGYEVEATHTAESGFDALGKGSYDLVITDIVLPGISGIEFLKKVKEVYPHQIVIIMTAYASLETAVEALRAGAYDYVVKPVMHEEIKQIARNALTQRALQRENLFLKKQLDRFQEPAALVGESAFIQALRNDLMTIAAGGKNVLISGEDGTGRKRIARVIHAASSRAADSFTALPCREISEGAVDIPVAGTVFLDELSDLSLDTQRLLSRAIDDAAGAVCFIGAASEEADSLVQTGRLDREFFGHMNGHIITIPPLRERKEDIMPLALHFLQRFSREFGKEVTAIDQEVKELFLQYPWPGNIRELQNILERAVLLTKEKTVRLSDLPQSLPVS